MANDFDSAAQNYDREFTHTLTGTAQRKQVYRLLGQTLKDNPNARILEINCGTGADAFWLANQNFRVTATDISAQMIAVASKKSNQANPMFQQADINNLSKDFADERFDLIFSNFGGLNCLSQNQLCAFFEDAARLLADHGQLALVIMPRNTKWEQLYFLAKADFKNAFRRKKNKAIAHVSGQNVTTYYYNPNEAEQLARDFFSLQFVRPIGFFVPPSYLDSFFSRNKPLFSLLQKLEQKAAHFPFLSRHSDHYLLALKKR